MDSRAPAAYRVRVMRPRMGGEPNLPGSAAADHGAPARALIALALAVAASALASLIPFWLDPALLDDDARMHLLGFRAARAGTVFEDRFLADYALGYVPPGYRVLMSAAAVFVDPHPFSKALGAVLLVSTWALAWRLGRQLGGTVGAAAALLLCVHAGFVFQHTFGGLPRGFGYPLLLAFIVAWIERRDVLLAGVLLAQALFYPPIFLVCWSAAALRVLLGLGRRVPVGRRGLGALAAASIVAAAVLVSFADTPPAWGRLATLQEAAAMGEFQREGGRVKLIPLNPYWLEALQSLRRGVLGHPDATGRADLPAGDLPASAAVAALVLVGVPGLPLARPRSAWALALLASAFGVYGVASTLALRLGEPDRALKFTLPVLVILAWPAAWGAASRMARRSGSAGSTSAIRRPIGQAWRVSLGAALAAVLVLPGPSPWARDITTLVVDARPERSLHAAIASLDARGGPVLIAGWPGGSIDNVPLLAGREIFVDYEHAHPYYLGYYAEVRRRIEDVVRLTFATDVKDAREIRNRNGLTHLLVDPAVLGGGVEPAPIFRPLDAFARAVAADRPAERRLFRDAPPAWIVFEDARWILFDLQALDDDAAADRGR